MALKFEAEKAMQDYINYFYEELDWALKAWEAEVYKYTRNKFLLKKNAEVNTYIQREENILIGFLEATPAILADSFGTGSLMNIQDNPNFKEYYKKESEGWNPLRSGKTIVGRKEGYYTDIFGNKRHSKGTYAGKPIEGKTFHGIRYEPIAPSNSLKIATDLLYKTYLPAAIRNANSKINFSKYLIEVKK